MLVWLLISYIWSVLVCNRNVDPLPTYSVALSLYPAPNSNLLYVLASLALPVFPFSFFFLFLKIFVLLSVLAFSLWGYGGLPRVSVIYEPGFMEFDQVQPYLSPYLISYLLLVHSKRYGIQLRQSLSRSHFSPRAVSVLLSHRIRTVRDSV